MVITNTARRRLLQLALLGVAGVVLASCTSAEQVEYEFRKRFLQNFSKLPYFEGSQPPATSYAGVALVVNIWASWCPPCVYEMPSLQKLGTLFQPQDLQIIAVSVDKDLNSVREFLLRNRLTFPVLLDHANTTLRAPNLPSTFLLRRDHSIAKLHVGDRGWAEPQVIDEVEKLLGVKRIVHTAK